ncbi:nicotinic acid mononucleotide adenylyltransferase, partial [Pseudomonas aeruginosa]|nr:nicotinic acid mononucleotide adenylyltransferase [Pseudomonas aeruginosa]
ELQRDKPSYTIDTLESVRAELVADDQLFMLIGWDAFCGLPTWHRWEALLDHCHIVVLQRPDADSEPPESLRDLLAARSVADPQALKGPGGQI